MLEMGLGFARCKLLVSKRVSDPAFRFNEKTNSYDLTVFHQRKEMRLIFRNGNNVASFELNVKITNIVGTFDDEDAASCRNGTNLILCVRIFSEAHLS
jgi:hypothetical protein